MVRSLARAGGIQTQCNPIIAEGSVPTADRRTNFVGFAVETVESEVYIAIVIGNAHVRTQVGMRTTKRVVGNPLAKREWLAIPDFIIQNAIDFWWFRRARDMEVRTSVRRKSGLYAHQYDDKRNCRSHELH